jgi:hypothetical protein
LSAHFSRSLTVMGVWERALQTHKHTAALEERLLHCAAADLASFCRVLTLMLYDARDRYTATSGTTSAAGSGNRAIGPARHSWPRWARPLQIRGRALTTKSPSCVLPRSRQSTPTSVRRCRTQVCLRTYECVYAHTPWCRLLADPRHGLQRCCCICPRCWAAWSASLTATT